MHARNCIAEQPLCKSLAESNLIADMATNCVDENSKPWMHAPVSGALCPQEVVLKGAAKEGAAKEGAEKRDSNKPREQIPENVGCLCPSDSQNTRVVSEFSSSVSAEASVECPPSGEGKRKSPHRGSFSISSCSEGETASTATGQLSPEPKASPQSPPSSSRAALPANPSLTATEPACHSLATTHSGEKTDGSSASACRSFSQTTASEAPSRLSSGVSTPPDHPPSERRGSEEHPAPRDKATSSSGAAVLVSGSSADNSFSDKFAPRSCLLESSANRAPATGAACACAEAEETPSQDREAMCVDAEQLRADEGETAATTTCGESPKDSAENRALGCPPARDSGLARSASTASLNEGEPAGKRGKGEEGEGESENVVTSAQASQPGTTEQSRRDEAPKSGGRVDAKMRAKFKREFVRSWVDINRAPSWPPIKKNKYLSSDWKRVDLRTAAGEIRVETKKHRLFLNDLCFLFDGVYTQKSTLGRKAGLGLFCERPEGLHKGQIITEFVGWLVDRDLAESYRKQRTASHIVAVQKGFLYIDGAKEPAYGMGGGSFANDGSEFLGGPGNNAQFYHWFDDELGRTRVFLRATADIKNGEEIFVPYHKTYWVDNFEEQAENCPDAFKQRKLEQLRRRYKNPEFVHIPHREEVALREKEAAERKKREKEESEKKKREAAKQPRCPVKRPCSAYLLYSVARRKELMKTCGISAKGEEPSEDAKPAGENGDSGRGEEAGDSGGRKRRGSTLPRPSTSGAAPSAEASAANGCSGSANKRRRSAKEEARSQDEGAKDAGSAPGSRRAAARPSASPGDETARRLASWLAKDSPNLRGVCAELTREIAREWGALSPEQKKPWEQVAEKEKARYVKAVQAWKEKLKKGGKLEKKGRKRKTASAGPRKERSSEEGAKSGDKTKAEQETTRPAEESPEKGKRDDNGWTQGEETGRCETAKER
ncbi:high mobility group (HMG) box domain-containing protein [Neospora caninum Liverpool]|uniref:High mobility group (HMG) box domain-containing protein n=1 Tax=Neospora caninum (strain Liverpool) TaxID=572307 RepID=F0VFS7_NEOCL|nr:high mobility group (HMG) box domain-containing protein [Neospora caninum Liverpool]CBZ52571.1 high mobility group (HMG) box domain-containing protein [Neospora caninum Liverpool]CEL66547.1 TPA: high mobility group (HMG) box domain-containing protein, putative [Neospora caninum Liverpool]|eukprot:XP_003882603.1 high mobility group (HMG) box domain-containing protein [Neospora caninum Liverpool]